MLDGQRFTGQESVSNGEIWDLGVESGNFKHFDENKYS